MSQTPDLKSQILNFTFQTTPRIICEDGAAGRLARIIHACR
jgi:hypothetical protein